MDFIIIKSGETGPKEFYSIKDFLIEGNIEWENDNETVRKILFTIHNTNKNKYGHVINSVNFCNTYKNNIKMNILEFHFKQDDNPSEKEEYEFMPRGKLKITKNMILFNLKHIYKKTEPIQKCKFGEIHIHPKTSKGNVIVGG